MTVPIYINDSQKLQENEDLGFEKNAECTLIVDMHFRRESLTAFWIDPEVDENTSKRDIIFYLGELSFRTPLKQKTIQLFNSCLDSK